MGTCSNIWFYEMQSSGEIPGAVIKNWEFTVATYNCVYSYIASTYI